MFLSKLRCDRGKVSSSEVQPFAFDRVSALLSPGSMLSASDTFQIP